MSCVALAITQVLLTCHPQGAAPLRFGFPFKARDLARGLRVEGSTGSALQWRRLQKTSDRATKRIWVELCIDRVPVRKWGTLRIVAGGAHAESETDGAVVRRTQSVEAEKSRVTEIVRWRWRSGVEDVVRTVTFGERQEFEGELFQAGESVTLGVETERFTRAGIPARSWRKAALLPGSGRIGRPYRRRLLEVVGRLHECTDLRDRGDYRRSGDVVTNLEFDTALAFARLGIAEARPDLLARAQRSAQHSIDIDLDARTGLLHRHGEDHRRGPPEPGHTWLQGLLLVGCLTADDRLVAAARRIARGLARRAKGVSRRGEGGGPEGQGREDRVRDAGWPLLQMEAFLRFAADAEVETAVAALVLDLRRRFDAKNTVFRFGEGMRSKGVFEEPSWVAAGCLVPGLRAYVQRTGDVVMRRILESCERRIASLIRAGQPGLPLRTWSIGGEVFSQARLEGSPRGFLLLEGLRPADVGRILGRRLVQTALADVPAWDDPDLPTSFSIIGRCAWIYR